VKGIDGVTPVKHRGIRRGRYQTFAPTEEKWFSDSESFGKAYPELLYYHDEDWTPNRLGAPAFCAGITFDGTLGDWSHHRPRGQGFRPDRELGAVAPLDDED
jgi:hypothetical protein